MKRIAILTALILAAVSAFGQAARVDLPLLTAGPSVPISGGPLPQALWVANAAAYLCTHPSATLVACQAAPITTYTDSTEGTTCPTATPLVQLPGNTCTASTGTAANVGFWYGGGVFDYWIVSSYGTYGPFSGNSSNSALPSSCGNPIGIPCGGTGATTAAGALTSLGAAALSGAAFTGAVSAPSASFSGTVAVVPPLPAFTNISSFCASSSFINGANQSMFVAGGALGKTTDAVCGAIIVPSNSTSLQSNAVSGMVDSYAPGAIWNGSTNSGGTNAVAGYFQSRLFAPSSLGWGINIGGLIEPGATNSVMQGIEMDLDVLETGAQVVGVSIPTIWNVAPASATGFYISKPSGSSGAKWNQSFWSDNGAATNAMLVGAMATTANQPSQYITFVEIDSGLTLHQGTIQLSSGGQFVLSPFAGGVVNLQGTSSPAFSLIGSLGTFGATTGLVLDNGSTNGISFYNGARSASFPQIMMNASNTLEIRAGQSNAGYLEDNGGNPVLVWSNGSVSTNGVPLQAEGGTNILYRCTVAGTLRVGQLTSVAADCGTAVDTGLRVN